MYYNLQHNLYSTKNEVYYSIMHICHVYARKTEFIFTCLKCEFFFKIKYVVRKCKTFYLVVCIKLYSIISKYEIQYTVDIKFK